MTNVNVDRMILKKSDGHVNSNMRKVDDKIII